VPTASVAEQSAKTEAAPGRVLFVIPVLVPAVICLELLAIFQHPGKDPAAWAMTAVGAGMLIALGAVAWMASRRAGRDLRGATWRLGTWTGLALGIMWIVEIGINNVFPADRVPIATRDLADDLIWGLIALATILVAGVAAHRADSIGAGVAVGIWSGAVSGLLAYLAGLLVVVLSVDALERSPDLVAEFPSSGAADLATYVTYTTIGSSPLAGAAGHLWLLGIGAGALLGMVGGCAVRLGGKVASAVAQIASPRP
jgi:hypothetical protein